MSNDFIPDAFCELVIKNNKTTIFSQILNKEITFDNIIDNINELKNSTDIYIQKIIDVNKHLISDSKNQNKDDEEIENQDI